MAFYLKTKHIMKGRVVFPQLHPHPQPSCSVICNRTRTYTQQFILYRSRNLPHTITTCNLRNFLTINRKRCSFYFITSTTLAFATYLHFFLPHLHPKLHPTVPHHRTKPHPHGFKGVIIWQCFFVCLIFDNFFLLKFANFFLAFD